MVVVGRRARQMEHALERVAPARPPLDQGGRHEHGPGRDDLAGELSAIASARIGRGEWPWSFFCYLEDAPRPVTPSSFRLLAPAEGALGLAVRCPACSSTSVNLVTPTHVDVPFHSDSRVGVAPHVFSEVELMTIDAFRAELDSATFDEKRLTIDG